MPAILPVKLRAPAVNPAGVFCLCILTTVDMVAIIYMISRMFDIIEFY